MTVPVEREAKPDTTEAAEEAEAGKAPVLQILGDPSVGVCTDEFCEVPGLSSNEPSSERT